MTVVRQTLILNCQHKMLLACLLSCKTVSTDALQVLMGAPPLVLRIYNVFRTTKGLPLLDGLNTNVVNKLNIRKRQTLLNEGIRALLKTC